MCITFTTIYIYINLQLHAYIYVRASPSLSLACLYIYIIYIAYFRRAAACTLACSMHTWFPSAQDFGTVAFGEPRFGLWESVALFGLHGLLSLTFRDSGHTHLPCASLDDDPAFRARQVHRIGIHVVIIVINHPFGNGSYMFIPPIYGDLGDSLLLFYPNYRNKGPTCDIIGEPTSLGPASKSRGRAQNLRQRIMGYRFGANPRQSMGSCEKHMLIQMSRVVMQIHMWIYMMWYYVNDLLALWLNGSSLQILWSIKIDVSNTILPSDLRSFSWTCCPWSWRWCEPFLRVSPAIWMQAPLENSRGDLWSDVMSMSELRRDPAAL